MSDPIIPTGFELSLIELIRAKAVASQEFSEATRVHQEKRNKYEGASFELDRALHRITELQ